jgi:cell division protein FtsI (penicillin-binding protein 3)
MRRPLRPLARILSARANGENPDMVEAEARAERVRARAGAERQKAEVRLLLLALGFLIAFSGVVLRMGVLATSVAAEPKAGGGGPQIVTARADIVDRHGQILATNLLTAAVIARPQNMADPRAAADGLARIFPDEDAEALYRRFTSGQKFVWVRRTTSPEQRQAVHDLGEPGLELGPREARLYPNGRLAAHVLGGYRFGTEGETGAEIIGMAGVEKAFDGFLRDPAEGGRPLELSLDLSVQAAVARVLEGGMALMNAKGASAVLMEAGTGQIVAMVSLPDFDPNDRPAPPRKGEPGAADPSDSVLFNRAAQGVYELGSTFKVLTLAQALDSGRVNPGTMIDTKGPMRWGRFTIRDFRNYGPRLSVTDVLVKSSNIGTARLALDGGTAAQQDFLRALGLFEAAPVELPEAARSVPLVPRQWSDLSTITISYGHGMAVTPIHLAAAYASLVNGGTRVTPSILKRAAPAEGQREGPRVVAEETSAMLRAMLRQVVLRGTATLGEVEGYRVGGKTGTADKPHPNGGYYEDKVISVFAGIFPADAPEYVLVVTLDEPVETSGTEERRTAGWTSVPVAAEIIRRIAPLMNLRPAPKQPEAGDSQATLATNG